MKMIPFFAAVLLALSALPCQALDFIEFSWITNPEPVDSYSIYYSLEPGPYPKSVNVGKPPSVNGRSNAVVDTSLLTRGVVHYFVCTARNVTGESGYSNVVSVMIPLEDTGTITITMIKAS